jgi:galactose mutarotase-like enzyme
VEEAHFDVSFEITNTGEEALPISIGAHPAFNWPLLPVQIQPQSGFALLLV